MSNTFMFFFYQKLKITKEKVVFSYLSMCSLMRSLRFIYSVLSCFSKHFKGRIKNTQLLANPFWDWIWYQKLMKEKMFLYVKFVEWQQKSIISTQGSLMKRLRLLIGRPPMGVQLSIIDDPIRGKITHRWPFGK